MPLSLPIIALSRAALADAPEVPLDARTASWYEIRPLVSDPKFVAQVREP